jgi:PPOX class probable F420-dependent enzyme
VSPRADIRMTDDEIDAFLAPPRTMVVASIGRDGRPHLVAMWYGFLDGTPALWTYAKSQKVRNFERDPRFSALVEDGRRYEELRGVELSGRVEIRREPADVLALGRSVHERYIGPVDEAAEPVVARMSAKRVAVRLLVERIVSWDHRRLGASAGPGPSQ